MARYDGFNQLSGTIGASGSLSQQIDTEGFDLQGLVLYPSGGTGTLAAGTVQFRVGFVSGTVYPLVDSTNTRVGLPYGTSAVAYSWVALQALRPYRYIVVETTVNQTQPVTATFPVKL